MAAASDKARFYLEQSIPELKEYERKKIFSKDEISSIAKKRSDFEHKLNARGSHPSDYARYAEYEMNLDILRRKRVQRLRIKAPSHSGQRRIYFILDRATRKFQGDLGLWMQYIEYARKQKSYKKLSQILTNVLRLHPAKPQLWIYAAQFVMEEHADMTEARSYMQRGLRFCKSSRTLWLEYAKLEMIYMAKIAARRKILGLDGQQQNTSSHDGSFEDADTDMLAIPKVTAEDVNPSLSTEDAVDEVALQNLESTPALSGAIPMAIFDSAIGQFKQDPSFSQDFYDMASQFENVPQLWRILQHIVDALLLTNPDDFKTHICEVKFSVAGIKSDSADFPRALGAALSKLKHYLQEPKYHHQRQRLALQAVSWLAVLRTQDLDPALLKVITSTLRQSLRSIDGAALRLEGVAQTELTSLASRLEDFGLGPESKLLLGTTS